MLYMIGTQAECMAIADVFSTRILQELKYYTEVLDREYGSDRDYAEVGGYALVAESEDDLQQVREVLDYDSHPCEWAMRLDGGYVSALYLMNNEFTVQLYMPEVIAPDDVLQELME